MPVAAEMFRLGRPFGLLPGSDEQCPTGMLPFGLRCAVITRTVPIPHPSTFDYDHDRQIGVIREGDRVTPLLKHTTGQTKTTTNPDGFKGPDSDSDHRED